MFETIYRGHLSELKARFETEPLRGEYVVVIAGKGYASADPNTGDSEDEPAP